MSASILTAPSPLDLDYVRSHFPALTQGWTFLDNAGGSQILRPVVERITEFLYDSNVQLGASYAVSQTATARVEQGTAAMATLINAAAAEEVVLGPSSSALFRILAHCLGQTLQPGDEIVVTNCDHEANISPWMELQRLGITVKTRSEEHTSELQSQSTISYAVFCLKKKKNTHTHTHTVTD